MHSSIIRHDDSRIVRTIDTAPTQSYTTRVIRTSGRESHSGRVIRTSGRLSTSGRVIRTSGRISTSGNGIRTSGRISTSGRVIRTSQRNLTQSTVTYGNVSRVIDTTVPHVSRVSYGDSRVISGRISGRRDIDGRVTTVRTSNYTKRYEDGTYDNSRIVKSVNRPGETYNYNNSSARVISREAVLTGGALITESRIETQAPVPQQCIRTVTKSVPQIVDNGKNKFSLESWTSYRPFLDKDRVYQSVVTGDNVYRSGQDNSKTVVRPLDTEAQFESNGYVTKRVYESVGGSRVLRTSQYGRSGNTVIVKSTA